ncbi:MAG: type II secretion system protein GspK [Verrucomicrobia bacterium]|nr:type II secretion system protein GspK [Verrucomicrobiota bacterium]
MSHRPAIPARASALPRPRSRGSVLVIVMITLLFTTFALVAFIEKASNDLLVEHREAQARRLRMEAYSALEVTLAVLEDFRQATNGLHSPAEGWNDPLGFAGYLPSEDRTVDITFEDESAKLSLPSVDAPVLSRLFQVWQVATPEADAAADALMGWMKHSHVYTTAITPDYDRGSLPYEAPGRSMRSYQELAAIEKIRELFYTEDGRPNDLWRRFVDNVSLLRYSKPNLNGAKPDVLQALGQFDPTQQQNLSDYTGGTGSFKTQGPAYFQNLADAERITGATGGNTGAFVTTISALRINVTVHDGRSEFRLTAVVTTGNAAQTVQTTATSATAKASAPGTATGLPQQNQTNNSANSASNSAKPTTPATGQAAAARNLNYPFTLLEIRENDEIPPPPPPPPPQP